MLARMSVDPDAVSAGGRTACELAEQLRAARSAWDRETQDGDSACGMRLARTHYTAMQDAWFDEFGVHITVLEQLGEAVRACATRFQERDERGSAAVEGIRGQ